MTCVTCSVSDNRELIVWTGYAKRIPVILFRPQSMISGFTDHVGKAVGGQYNCRGSYTVFDLRSMKNDRAMEKFQGICSYKQKFVSLENKVTV